MEKTIDERERLYRAVKRSRPNWLDQEGKPTPAMYKDKGGNSVDRDGGREENAVICYMEEETFKGRLKGVVRLAAGECMAEPNAVEVQAAPTENNPYHANLILDEKDIFKSNLQALKLADISRVVYLNQEMKWVDI